MVNEKETTMTDDDLLALVKRVDPRAVRLPSGIKAIAAAIEAAERKRWAVPVQELLTAHDAGLARVGEQMRAHGLTTLRLPYEVKAELDAIAVLRALTPNL